MKPRYFCAPCGAAKGCCVKYDYLLVCSVCGLETDRGYVIKPREKKTKES